MERIRVSTARACLGRLLQRVEGGEVVAIVRNGRDVALLVPARTRGSRPALAAAIARWRRVRDGASLSLGLGGPKVKDLCDEGRP